MRRNQLLIITLTLVYSCAPTITRQSSTDKYDEDLSAYRPMIPESSEVTGSESVNKINKISYIEPTQHINDELDSVLTLMTLKNLEIGYLPGFSIQIYSGRSREEANNAKQAVYDLLEDETAVVYYDQPVFRVKVGKYFSKLEAEKNFRTLKDNFPQALVLPERIRIK
ncbi:MAG: SPOR domain-containing protein [Bacteroidetes bacterium]|nr:SPOR domain-containing protein [Bacteroidota bacterium]MDA1118969.1 SPOR domain-containing protein [Bacteroidota bacterium]